MAKLKLGAIEDIKPIKVSLELPAAVHRKLAEYAEALGKETGRPVSDPIKLIAPMIERFMATDRGFTKTCRDSQSRRQPAGAGTGPRQ
jgi:hypothetical protein